MVEMHVLRPEEQGQAEALWSLCFGDAPPSVSLSFDRIGAMGTILVLTQKDLVCGECSLLPCRIDPGDGTGRDSTYLYALCVRPDQRGNGFATALIQFADYFAENSGCTFSCVVPAEPWMHSMYQKCGYGECFRARTGQVSSAPSGRTHEECCEQIAPDAYRVLRETILHGQIHVSYGREFLDYQRELYDARYFRLSAAGGNGCACASRNSGGSVLFHELLAPGWETEAAAAVLAAFHASHGEYRAPDPDGQSLGMLRIYDPAIGKKWDWTTAVGYLGFPLD